MARAYSQLTIKLLFGTATHCAFPGCRNKLILRDRGLLTPIAEIAHIRSATVNGPRYDATYPESMINEFDNLLLLCGLHHPLVDFHHSAYPTAELLEWKERQTAHGVRSVGDIDLAVIDFIINNIQPILEDAILRRLIAHLGEAEQLSRAEDGLQAALLNAAKQPYGNAEASLRIGAERSADTTPADASSNSSTLPAQGIPHPLSMAQMMLERALSQVSWSAGRRWNQLYQPTATAAPFRLDLWWPDKRLVIEIDGPEHRVAAHFAADRARDVRLQLAGLRVLRFTNDQVLQNSATALAAIEKMLAVPG